MDDKFQEDGLAAIEALDNLARGCKADLPDDVTFALAHTAALVCTTPQQIKCLVVVMKQMYRAGYNRGQQITETQLGVNIG